MCQPGTIVQSLMWDPVYNRCPPKAHFRAYGELFALTLARKGAFDGHQLYRFILVGTYRVNAASIA